MLKITPLSAFSDNYIWTLINPDNHHCAVVDPGDAAPVLATLKTQQLTLDSILITHHHWDHTGGVNELKKHTGCRVYAPKNDPIPGSNHTLQEGDKVQLGKLAVEFEVIDIPGHTLGHIAYFGAGALFCGDTLFSAGCGRIFEGTPAQMLASLNKLKNLPDETRVYCGHEYTVSNLKFAQRVEPSNAGIDDYLTKAQALRAKNQPTLPSTIALEKQVNPFLRSRCAEIAASASEHAGTALTTELDVFTEIRRWKSAH